MSRPGLEKPPLDPFRSFASTAGAAVGIADVAIVLYSRDWGFIVATGATIALLLVFVAHRRSVGRDAAALRDRVREVHMQAQAAHPTGGTARLRTPG